tara:strand:+ start:5414 stop:5593 length:180 start_codon:yes stop_codon:yes gene_type:complete
MNYLGFEYTYDDDIEEDNIKRWHYVAWPGGKITPGPWGPYETPSYNEFRSFVEKLINET